MKYPVVDVRPLIQWIRNNSYVMIPFNYLEYKKTIKKKAVKKTLSIPEWLNDLAIKENVNFSQVLQEALIEKLVDKI